MFLAHFEPAMYRLWCKGLPYATHEVRGQKMLHESLEREMLEAEDLIDF